jgi:hypothetical protein
MERLDRNKLPLLKLTGNLMELVAAGTPAATVAPKIEERQDAIRTVEARLRRPRAPRLATEKLRAALEQRAAEWKADLRAEPRIARLVLRKLVGPIVLHDESERPDCVKWEAQPTTELLHGLAPTLLVAPPRGCPMW